MSAKTTSLDADSLSVKEAYKILTGTIVPRPIALVSTINNAGIGNLAPFSFFNGVSSNPPCLSIAIARKPDGSKKDTLLNIEANGEFVVNTVSGAFTEKMVQCGALYPEGINELEKAGLTPIPSQKIKPVRVLESAVHFECTVYETLEIGSGEVGSSTLIIGRIQMVHLSESVYRDGKVITEALDPVARLAGDCYATLGTISHHPIPKV